MRLCPSPAWSWVRRIVDSCVHHKLISFSFFRKVRSNVCITYFTCISRLVKSFWRSHSVQVNLICIYYLQPHHYHKKYARDHPNPNCPRPPLYNLIVLIEKWFFNINFDIKYNTVYSVYYIILWIIILFFKYFFNYLMIEKFLWFTYLTLYINHVCN